MEVKKVDILFGLRIHAKDTLTPNEMKILNSIIQKGDLEVEFQGPRDFIVGRTMWTHILDDKELSTPVEFPDLGECTEIIHEIEQASVPRIKSGEVGFWHVASNSEVPA